jgi:hypothetical protein
MKNQPFPPHEWDLIAGAVRARAYLVSTDAKRNASDAALSSPMAIIIDSVRDHHERGYTINCSCPRCRHRVAPAALEVQAA